MQTKKLNFLLLFLFFSFFLAFPKLALSNSGRQEYLSADKCYKELRASKTKQKKETEWLNCIKRFENIYISYPLSGWAPAGMYRAAELYLQLFKHSKMQEDRREAADLLVRVKKIYPKSAYRYRADNLLKDLLPKVTGNKHITTKQAKKENTKAMLPPQTTSVAKNVGENAFVTGLRFWSNPKYTRIAIDVDKESDYVPKLMKKDPSINIPFQRLYIDIDNSKLATNFPEHISINDKLLKRVRAGQHRPKGVRIVVDIKSFQNYKVFSIKNPFRIIVDFWGKTSSQVSRQNEPVKSSQKKIIPSPSDQAKRDVIGPEIKITSHKVRGIAVIEAGEKTLIIGKATDQSGIVAVTINHKTAALDSDGNFSANIYLKVGKNQIVVRAMDVNENKSNKSFTIYRKETKIVQNQVISNPVKPQTCIPGWYTKQKALIIGIDSYRSNEIERLSNAVNDARAVASALKEMGFDVTELYNDRATRKGILTSFSKIVQKSEKDHGFIFYFAGHGHGIQLENKEQIGYIIPHDADLNLMNADIFDFDNEAIKLSNLRSYCKNMKAKHVALILDSCFSGLVMKRSIPTVKNMNIKYYEDLLNRKAINILTAGDDQPVSDGTGHSPFTQAILNGLGKGNLDIHDRDGFATFTELSVYVKKKVEKITNRRQRPQFDNLSIDDGDFIFKIIKE